MLLKSYTKLGPVLFHLSQQVNSYRLQALKLGAQTMYVF